MAKKQLTIEEKLQAALVPVEEQPYKLPENWCWVRLSSLLRELKNGTTIKQDKSGNGYKVTRIESLQQQTIDFDRLGNIVDKTKIKENDWYEAGDVALSHINSAEHVGKTAVIQENMLPLVHGMNLLRLRFNDLCQPVLFQFFSRSYQYKSEIRARINMAVNQVSINQKSLGTVEFPLPPLKEQSRIVARIESLFAKLDEAKEKIQEVLDGADLRRAAILHQAFTGNLTEKWRRENGVSDDSWEETMFDDCIDKMQNGLSKRKGSAGESYAVLRLANIGVADVNTDDLRYIMLDDKEISKYELNHGDVLMIRVNGSRDNVGKQIYVNNPIKWAFCDHLIRIKYKDSVSAQFMRLLSETHSYRRYIKDNMVSSAGQNTISRKGMQDYKVNLPSMPEQHEIVRLLDNLLSREQSTVTACEEALTTIDTLKKSILARAFRGELGTNDPAEPSAQGLLQEILEA